MLTVRKSNDRGTTETDWLHSRHSFSFGEYYDRERMNFGALRVINEDWIMPAAGFPTHGHRDMEIITYVIEGRLAHKDSLGNGSEILPGDVQRMSAGTGIRHSEFNALSDKPTHLLQIWILPEREGLMPGYEQKNFASKRKPGALTLLASRDGKDGSVTVHQDAALHVLDLAAGQPFTYPIAETRMLWVQVVRGNTLVNGYELKPGDGMELREEHALHCSANADAELLIFDLPAQ